MKTFVISNCVVIAVFCAALGCAQEPAEQKAASPEIVATFEGGSITAAELEEIAADSLAALRQQVYDAKSNALEQAVFDRLVDMAAQKEEISRDEYLKIHITEAAPAPSEEEIAKVLDQYRARLPKDEAEARQQVVNYLSQQSNQKAAEALKQKLFNEANVRMLLEPPRVEPAIQMHNPTQGADDAVIVMVEYTDFQCPYCGRAQETIEKVMATYGGQLKHVFKHLPLPMHQQANVAAQGSLCAADQGLFWEMHDWMFANRSSLDAESQIAQAEVLGLDTEAFKTCLESKVHAADVDQDMAEARRFGITGTPGFVINGRILKGAQPFDAFAKIINDELRRKGLPVPEPVEPKKEEPEEQPKIKTLPSPPDAVS